MEIIKKGKIFEPERTYKLKCEHCGCVFTFDADEIIAQEKRLMGSASVKCPYCNSVIDFKPMDCLMRKRRK